MLYFSIQAYFTILFHRDDSRETEKDSVSNERNKLSLCHDNDREIPTAIATKQVYYRIEQKRNRSMGPINGYIVCFKSFVFSVSSANISSRHELALTD